jgi:hypothetical protein
MPPFWFWYLFVAGLVGLGLGFWHQRLMAWVHARHPAVWSELGGQMFPGDEWSPSVRQPFWSLKSAYFFIRGDYKKLGDPLFSARADPFRLAFLSYWIACSIAILYLMFAN